MSYNVHNLLQIAEDVKKFGTVDVFSAFKYENYMQKIKSSIKSSGKPLQQFINRITEKETCTSMNYNNPRETSYPAPIYSRKINRCISVNFKMFILSKKECDSVFLTKSGLLVFSFLLRNKEVSILAKKCTKLEPYFCEPCNSEFLDIYIIKNENVKKENVIIKLNEVKTKCMKIAINENENVIIPLLYCENMNQT